MAGPTIPSTTTRTWSRNPDFTIDYEGWSAYGVTGGVKDGMFCGEYYGPHRNEYDAGFGFNGMTFPAGDYFASFDAKSEAGFHRARCSRAEAPTRGSEPSTCRRPTRCSTTRCASVRRAVPVRRVPLPRRNAHRGAPHLLRRQRRPQGSPQGLRGRRRLLRRTRRPGVSRAPTATVGDTGVCIAVPRGNLAPERCEPAAVETSRFRSSRYELKRDVSGSGGPCGCS